MNRRLNHHRHFSLALLVAAVLSGSMGLHAQTATISDAWWSYQQDCDGDGRYAGMLENERARLGWFPDVRECNGSLTVFEKVYSRLCGTSLWHLIFTNAPHSIAGCRSSNQQFVDVALGTNGTCRDYLIEIYRLGSIAPDASRSSTNDVGLAQHIEEALGEDVCGSDTFLTCVTLPGTHGAQFDHNAAATKQPGEPDHAGNPGGHSLWYCWTASTNLPVTFDTEGSSFDTLLAVYTGDLLPALTVVTNNDDIAGATNRFSRVTFTPETGVTYRIAVDGFGDAVGMMELNWNQGLAELPDLVVYAPATTPSITTTTFAGSDCQVLEGCASGGQRKLLRFTMETRNIGGGDLVLGDPSTNHLFRFASCHGHYHFEAFAQTTLLDTNLNPVLLDANVVVGRKIGFCIADSARWRPTAPAAARYDCKNMGLQSGWSDTYDRTLDCQFMDITGVPAGQYYLQLTVNPDALLTESRLDNNTLLVPVVIPPTDCLTSPDNDAFTNATPVPNPPFSLVEFNACASTEAWEPHHASDPGGHSLWHTWTAPTNELLTLTTRRSSFDTLLAVYTGTAINDLTMVTNNNDILPGTLRQSAVTFSAIAGTTYHIAIDGYQGAVGTVVLNFNPPPNDDFAQSTEITGPSGTVGGYTTGASKELNEVAHASDVGGHSVWFRWIAPTNGFVDFNTSGSAFDTTLAVYTNAVIASTNLAIAANDDDAGGGGLLASRLFFYAAAGTVYHIAVDGFGGDSGNYQLSWNMESRLTLLSQPDGMLALDLTGVDWQRYLLLDSSNLQNWSTNSPPITMSRGRHEYTNSVNLTNGALRQRFFRAVQLP